MPPGAHSKRATVGQVNPGLEARVVDDGGKDVEPGQDGELWLRGPMIMKCVLVPLPSSGALYPVVWREKFHLLIAFANRCRGYLHNPSATKETMAEGGWLKTGDVARADVDGFFTIVDRKKELIKYKAYQGSSTCFAPPPLEFREE